MNSTYSVSPSYSGIWPIYPALFKIWSEEFSIKTTSTENYLDVNNLTRGFIYNNIMVAPRQPSIIFKKGLQSNSSRNNDLPIWFSNNDKEVCQFETILTNNVLIFNSNCNKYYETYSKKMRKFFKTILLMFVSCCFQYWAECRDSNP